jgi:hypothetical protein
MVETNLNTQPNQLTDNLSVEHQTFARLTNVLYTVNRYTALKVNLVAL